MQAPFSDYQRATTEHKKRSDDHTHIPQQGIFSIGTKSPPVERQVDGLSSRWTSTYPNFHLPSYQPALNGNVRGCRVNESFFEQSDTSSNRWDGRWTTYAVM